MGGAPSGQNSVGLALPLAGRDSKGSSGGLWLSVGWAGAPLVLAASRPAFCLPARILLFPPTLAHLNAPPCLQSMAAAAAEDKDPDILRGGGHDSAANLADLGLQVGREGRG